MNKFLTFLILSMLAIGGSAFAGEPICNSIQECQDVISQAQARLKELSNGSEERVSNTGAIFIRDSSIPALGGAYKDPSGLIWGSIVMEQGQVNKMTQDNADKYCKDGGARLPTKEEFEQLAKYLGRGTAIGYSPYLADGKTSFLPGLSSNWFWSSSVNPSSSDDAFNFNGNYGYVVNDNRYYDLYAVRCIGGR